MLLYDPKVVNAVIRFRLLDFLLRLPARPGVLYAMHQQVRAGFERYEQDHARDGADSPFLARKYYCQHRDHTQIREYEQTAQTAYPLQVLFQVVMERKSSGVIMNGQIFSGVARMTDLSTSFMRG